MFCKRKGYDLERGIKGSNTKYPKTKEFKKMTRYYENKVFNSKLAKIMSDFEKNANNEKYIIQ